MEVPGPTPHTQTVRDTQGWEAGQYGALGDRQGAERRKRDSLLGKTDTHTHTPTPTPASFLSPFPSDPLLSICTPLLPHSQVHRASAAEMGHFHLLGTRRWLGWGLCSCEVGEGALPGQECLTGDKPASRCHSEWAGGRGPGLRGAATQGGAVLRGGDRDVMPAPESPG